VFQVSLHPQEPLQCLRQAPEERQQAGLTQHQIEGETVPSLVRQLCSMAPRFLRSGLAVDGDNRVYVLSTQLRVVRLERHGNTYTQSPYAPPFPDLPVCTSGGPVPCSPTLVDFPPLPNEMAFDDDGFLYVTDSLQATIYRIPPGGGAADIWF
jgi:sugar lactone lactonase YvrE